MRIISRNALRWIVVTALVAAFLFVHAAGAFAQGGEPRYFAIRGAKIVPVSGPPIDSGTVVIANGLIAAVGKDVPIPPEAWVIEGKGLTVYPGFIDALTDVGLATEPTAPAGQPGGARLPAPISRGPEDRPGTTPWRSAADELKPDDKRIETWRNGGFTTAIVAPKGGIFPGQASVVDLAGERPGDLVVKPGVALPLSLQPVGNFTSFPGSLMGVLGHIHQVWLDTAWYTQAFSIYDRNPRGLERPAYDRTEVTLADALRRNTLVLIPANNDTQLLRGLALADRWKVRSAIYGAQQSYAVADALAARKLPVIINLKWPEKNKDADPDAEEPLRLLEFRDRAPSSPAALSKVGVKFAFSSGGLATSKDALKAAKKSIDAGLSAGDALRALTLSAAEIYGVADRLGSIESGKIANLVVADGDLFNEKTKVKFVFVDGERFEVREPSRPTEPPKGNLTGQWKLSYTTPEGPEEVTADLTMAPDGTLSGTFTRHGVSVSVSSGWVSADKFSFMVPLTFGGQTIDVTFSGTFEGNSMKGTASGGGATVDFTGSKPGRGGAQ
jgi:imidazolonepropionase-like amidohydrolase